MKLKLAAMVLTSALALVACGKQAPPSTTTPTEPGPTDPGPTDPTPAPTVTGLTGGVYNNDGVQADTDKSTPDIDVAVNKNIQFVFYGTNGTGADINDSSLKIEVTPGGAYTFVKGAARVSAPGAKSSNPLIGDPVAGDATATFDATTNVALATINVPSKAEAVMAIEVTPTAAGKYCFTASSVAVDASGVNNKICYNVK